jgi:hypothetical protein
MVVMMGMVMIVCECITQNSSRRDADCRSPGINRLDRTSIGIVGGHAADSTKRACGSNKSEGGKLAGKRVFHSCENTKNHK